MPGGDRTGPMGLGPMTGRGVGYCAGYGVPGYANPGYGWRFSGRGFGRGGGRGRRRWLYAPAFTGWLPVAPNWQGVAPAWPAGAYASPFVPAMTHQQEIDALKGQAQYVEDVLNGLRRRMEELETRASKA